MKNIFVNGTFDILHIGHLRMLQYAKTLGTVTVGIDSDIRVNQLKSMDRPVNTQLERAEMLIALKYVDNVVVFNTDAELVDLVRECDIMVKGSDYKGKYIVGEDVCKQIIFFDRIDGLSTTEKIQNIANRR